MKCKRCKRYFDAFEWPQDELIHFKHDLCYECYKSQLEEDEAEEEEAENFDPNTAYGLSEIKPDPEDDDAPDLGSEDEDLTTTDEIGETEDGTETETSAEDKSIQELTRMLFGGDRQDPSGCNLSPVLGRDGLNGQSQVCPNVHSEPSLWFS